VASKRASRAAEISPLPPIDRLMDRLAKRLDFVSRETRRCRVLWAVLGLGLRLHLHVEVELGQGRRSCLIHRIGRPGMFAQLTSGGDFHQAIRCSVDRRDYPSRRPLASLVRLACTNRA